MVSEMESVKNVTNSVNNSSYMTNASPQPVHSPQSVGIEFVRQYYTMLNRAPQLLFRFYSDDSTFVHGCLDKHGEPIQYVRGQKQINAKIMSLNFKNCHTKIRQVDSMETIGNGVVIQVIGELSNNGQPLRRFLQTFVLTPQSPNKYYVRNDIFRYQEEYLLDESEEQIEKSDIETKIETTNVETEIVEPIETNDKDYSYQANGTMTNAVVEHIPPVDESVMDQDEPEPVEENSIDNSSLVEIVPETKEQLGEVEPEEHVEVEEEVESVSEATTNASHLLNEPKTYANMVSKSFQGTSPNLNSTKPTTNVSVTPVNVPPEVSSVVESVVAPPVVNTNTTPTPTINNNTNTTINNNNKSAGFPPQRERYINKKSGFNRRNESRESNKNPEEEIVDSGDGSDHLNASKSGRVFPDDHQLFIGNLLPNFSEDDLQNIFARYGKILEIRINRQTHKTNSNKANRNYGFITFENPDVVDQIIAQKPIYHGNHRYNVEKKQGKSNYNRNQSNNSAVPRNGIQQNAVPSAPNPIRNTPLNAGGGGQGNPGPRPRPGQNYNSVNNNSGTGNRSFASNQNYNNRNIPFNHQQQQQQQNR